MNKLKEWTIKQLYEAMLVDLTLCNTNLERTMCKTIATKEMRNMAASLKRKLTPGEQSILDNLNSTSPSMRELK